MKKKNNNDDNHDRNDKNDKNHNDKNHDRNDNNHDNPIKPDSNNSSDDPPLDDYGIDHDRLLELCEMVIRKMHNKYIIEDQSPNNAAEFKEVAQTLESIWRLTKDILSLDDVIQSAMNAIVDGAIMGDEELDEFDDGLDDENEEDEENE